MKIKKTVNICFTVFCFYINPRAIGVFCFSKKRFYLNKEISKDFKVEDYRFKIAWQK
jgi:hypothetical protein